MLGRGDSDQVKVIHHFFFKETMFVTNALLFVFSQRLAIQRGRKLLHYVLEDNRVYFDTDLARRLGKIRFVPVDFPVKIESGGFVSYSQEVCRFDQTMGAGCGALGFTIFPILPRDLSPPQVVLHFCKSELCFVLKLYSLCVEYSFISWDQRFPRSRCCFETPEKFDVASWRQPR
jgi:hypothetical protein